MKHVDIVEFNVKHVAALEDSENELQYVGEEFIDHLSEGPGYTGVVDDKVIGCGGVRMFWSGVGEAWGIYPLRTFYAHIKEVLYYTRTGLYTIIDDYDLKRIQATARCDFPCAQNWLRHLGFSIEAKMKCYCPSGKDTFLYSITRK
jgi:hypothetical protein